MAMVPWGLALGFGSFGCGESCSSSYSLPLGLMIYQGWWSVTYNGSMWWIYGISYFLPVGVRVLLSSWEATGISHIVLEDIVFSIAYLPLCTYIILVHSSMDALMIKCPLKKLQPQIFRHFEASLGVNERESGNLSIKGALHFGCFSGVPSNGLWGEETKLWYRWYSGSGWKATRRGLSPTWLVRQFTHSTLYRLMGVWKAGETHFCMLVALMTSHPVGREQRGHWWGWIKPENVQ